MLKVNTVLVKLRAWDLGVSVINNVVICHWCEKGKEAEMDRACNTHGRDEKCIQNFSEKTRMEVTTLRGLDEDERLYLNVI
jgi:recombinational DNA repair protein RecR